MIAARKTKAALAAVLVLVLLGGVGALIRATMTGGRTTVVAYFDNSNGIFLGDEVRILGVPVGAVEKIEPMPSNSRITFWVKDKYAIPADAMAVIIAPSLVTSRAIQLTPAYDSGPRMESGATIPSERTAVPVEWDDFRDQLEKLTDALQPTEPGGVSTLGAVVNTAADNLRGQGTNIRESIVELSRAVSALGDHSGDVFGTIKNLSTLVTALQSSTDLMGRLNQNLAAVTALVADDPDEVDRAVSSLYTAVKNVKGFVAENRENVGIASDRLASISAALVDSLDDLEQTLHIAPTAFSNYMNIYEPAHASLTGILALTNFANPIQFLCSAVEAASRLGHEESAKLCVQYLAPIVKNRQYNFPPIGMNPFVNAQARPNEVTYSEDWMRPDFVPPAAPAPLAAETPVTPAGPAEGYPIDTDPAAGLSGLMLPPEDSGS